MCGILSACGGGAPFEDDELDEPTIEGLDLSPLKSGRRSLLVFDDFNCVWDGGISFVKHLFPIVKGQGTLTFVSARGKGIANHQNGDCLWKGFARTQAKLTTKKNLQQRTPKWTKAQFEALVWLRCGDEVDTGRIVPESEFDGNPFDALHWARKEHGREGTAEHRSEPER